jgi:hypothetical protein
MSPFTFTPNPQPFPRWMGPFSPARGVKSGFRFHTRLLGTWVGDAAEPTFWSVTHSQGARDLANLVRGQWGGGRVLLLANGFVVKPLQQDIEVGQRALIGRFEGAVVLDSPTGRFDLSNPGAIGPGDTWPGPTTTGLECVLKENGSLVCKWYHPTRFGREEVAEVLRGADRNLWHGFKAARPGDDTGRVRITANGLIITNRQEHNGSWTSVYVGRIDPSTLYDSTSFIREDWT